MLLIPLENSGTGYSDAPRAECKISRQKKIQCHDFKVDLIASQIPATPNKLQCLLLMKQPAHDLPVSVTPFSLDSNR